MKKETLFFIVMSLTPLCHGAASSNSQQLLINRNSKLENSILTIKEDVDSRIEKIRKSLVTHNRIINNLNILLLFQVQLPELSTSKDEKLIQMLLQISKEDKILKLNDVKKIFSILKKTQPNTNEVIVLDDQQILPQQSSSLWERTKLTCTTAVLWGATLGIITKAYLIWQDKK